MKISAFHKKSPRIEMLPLIDVVFLLLVVFIYAMLSMSVHKGLPVTLPTSSQAHTDKKTVLAVTVQADGHIFVNKQPVVLEELGRLLQRQAQSDHETAVLLFADRHLAYQDLFRVLDQVRKAGLTRISLQAQQETKQ